jgi:hypothetical protein
MRKWSQWFVLGLIVILMATAAAFGDDDPAQVPVQKIVLFTSGVGYFEHTGQVDGDATATLMFSTDQINDVLRSRERQLRLPRAARSRATELRGGSIRQPDDGGSHGPAAGSGGHHPGPA